MAKGILEFNLDDEYEKLGHKRAVYATDAFLALYDIQSFLRRCYKNENYKGKELSDSELEFLEKLREDINDIIIDRVNMEDLP